MECNTGLMAHIMKATGVLAKLRVKVLFGMLKETSTEANSKTIWPMDSENIRTLMGPGTRENS